MEKNNGIKFILFGIILLIIIIGGYILMMKSMPENNKPKKKEEVKVIDNRINKKKSYIYFKNEKHASEEYNIEYMDIVLNFKNNTVIEKELNEETANMKKTFKTDEDSNVESAKYKLYNIHEYDKYLSLVVDYYSFNKEDLGLYEKSSIYVFNKETGKLYSEEELLKEFNMSKEDVLKKIEEYIDAQSKLKEEQEIDVDKTMDNIKNLNLFVDRIGRLNTSVLVKSDQKDYNEVIILN